MISALVKEPFNLGMDQIARLTDPQLETIYFRPEKKPGQPPPGAVRISEFEMYWTLKRRAGLTDAAVVEQWRRERPEAADEAVVDPRWRDGG